MNNSLIRFCGTAVFGLSLLTALNAAEPQQRGRAPEPTHVVKAPRDARQLRNRTDLTDLFKQQPEIRIIVGLQTPQESGQLVASTPDAARERSVSARQARMLGRVQGLNVRDIKPLRFHPFVAMTVDATALGALLADPDVTSVSEDGVLYPLLVQTAPLTRADSAWAEGFRGAGQTVAVLDSGLDVTHPFFAGKVVGEACFSNPGAGSTTLCPNGEPQQIGSGAGINCTDNSIGCWHGTHVAGIAAGNYGYMTATTGGMAPDASVMPIQVYQRDCSTGTCQLSAYYSDIMLSLEYVYSLRNSYSIAAANLSMGGANFTATCDNEAPGITSVIQSLRAANIATVIAAGNAALTNAISFPGCISQAISVGSTTKQSAISGFSNSASFLSLLAPGTSISSSMPGGGFASTDGTSMAAPHVAGAWATLKSAKPSATVPEVLAALTTGGKPITDPRNGVAKPLIQIGDSGTELGALGVLLGRAAPAGAEIIIDNAAAGVADASGGRTFTGTWCTAAPLNEFGAEALFNCAGAATATYRWTPTIPNGGTFDVYVWWSGQSYQSDYVPVTVVAADGAVTKFFNQSSGGGQWVRHGRYTFNAGAAGYVEVSNGGAGQVSADAVRFVPIVGAPPMPLVTINASDSSASEADLNPGTLTFTRTGTTASALTVLYKVGGTATSGADYLALSGQITIPAGASSASIPVSPSDDALQEEDESIIVALLDSPDYTTGTPSTSTITLVSDDGAASGTASNNLPSSAAEGNRTFTPALRARLRSMPIAAVTLHLVR